MVFVETSENDPGVPEGIELTADQGHTQVALSRLIERWLPETHPNLAALVTIFVDQVQDLEDAFWGVLMQRSLDFGVGVQLDVIGRIVGQPRNGLEDEAYRAHLRARIRINSSNGTAEDVIAVVQLVDSARFRVAEGTIARMLVWFEEPLADSLTARELPSLVKQARAAGVSCLVEMPVSVRGARFGSVYGPALNAGIGFSSVYDSSVGGLFAHAARA